MSPVLTAFNQVSTVSLARKLISGGATIKDAIWLIKPISPGGKGEPVIL